MAINDIDMEAIKKFETEANKLVEVEMTKFAPETFQPLMPEQTRVSNYLFAKPDPPDVLLTCNGTAMLNQGIVGGIIATGGTGKTYLMCQLAYAMAGGRALGPIKPTGPFKVLILIAEDPQDELDRRLWSIGSGCFSENLHAVSVVGKIGTITEFNENGNPARSKWFDWLEQTIINHPRLDVLMIDPKSRFDGLNENSNEHGTFFIACLEYLSVKYNLTIIFSHHTSKDRSGIVSQNMSRGASSIIDGGRWAVGLSVMDSKTAENFEIKDPKNYVYLDVTKTNYTPCLVSPLYFKRESNGVLKYVTLSNDRIKNMAERLTELLSESGHELTRRELRREKGGKSVADDLLGEFHSFSRRNEMDKVIDHAIENGWLIECEIGQKPHSKKVIRPSGQLAS